MYRKYDKLGRGKGLMMRELPENELPREKMISGGVRSLSNTELVAVLLGSGSRSESALSLAQRVLSLERGSLPALAGYEPEEFMRLPGIGEAKACTLSAALELSRRTVSSGAALKPVINCPDDAAALFMDELRYLKKEVFRTALLNVKKEVIMKDEVSVGGINFSSAEPREVFSKAVKKGAAGMILVHNHPSGDPKPSQNDIALTKQLVQAGKIMGISVVDHIIIGDGVYFSFLDEKLL